MKKLILLLASIVLTIGTSFSVNYVSSGVGPANWATASSWTPSGVPGVADNVTIQAGHTITVGTATANCANLVVDGTLSFISTFGLNIYGNYTVNGTESGNGGISFNGSIASTMTISGAGTFSPTTTWQFRKNIIIASNVIVNKTQKTTLLSATVRNNGNVTLNQMVISAGASWIQEVNSQLTLNGSSKNFFTGTYQNIGTFNASATGNTVTISYFDCDLPNTVSGYYNLILTYGGTKNLKMNTTILNDLTITRTGASQNVLNTNNFDLTIRRHLTKTNGGHLTASAGKSVIFDGTTAQTINSAGSTLVFTGLTINNTAGLTLSAGTFNLTEVLTVSNGVFNVNGRPFTMISTAGQTARIAPISGSGSITGTFIIQRFITTRDTTWSDMASPVQSSNFADWATELPARHYGAFPTQYSYDEAADDFVGIFSATTPLVPGKGYEVFLTGDFAYANLPNTTLDTKGTPNQGNQDLSGLISFDNAGSNLVGNPFASSISWSSVFAASSGIENYFDVYDFTTGNYNSFGLGDEIGLGQGFWVYTNSPAYSLIINESAKTTSSNSTLRSNDAIQPYLKLKLYSAMNTFSHEVKFSASSTATTGFAFGEDRVFHKSPNKAAPYINCTLDGKKTNLNTFSSFEDNYSAPLSVYAGIAGTYTLNASGIEFISNDYSCITIEDLLLNKTINLNEQTNYSFLLDAGETNNRFVIHFSKSGDCKSMVNTPITSSIENQVQVLPTLTGNIINFNFEQTLSTTVSVVNLLGQ
ncbi:MAG: hypothetical protein JNL69_13490, partial [Bacteroidia bacterium]|nr:hypothetical protein [Bacteroidia bacterium]